MRSDVEKNAAMVKLTVHDVILSAMDILIVPGKELVIGSADVSSTRNRNSVELNPYQWDFSGDIKGLQISTY